MSDLSLSSVTEHGDALDARRTVTAFLQCLGAGDHVALAALFADEVDWRLDWPAEELTGAIPWIRPRRTPADVVAHFRTLAECHAPHPQGTTVERVLTAGPDAVVLGTIRNVVRHSGVAYEARFALHLTVERGRIVRYHIYEDSLAVARAWHGPAGDGARPRAAPPAHRRDAAKKRSRNR